MKPGLAKAEGTATTVAVSTPDRGLHQPDNDAHLRLWCYRIPASGAS